MLLKQQDNQMRYLEDFERMITSHGVDGANIVWKLPKRLDKSSSFVIKEDPLAAFIIK